MFRIKKKIIFIKALILIAVSIYFFNEYKTKSFVKDLLHTVNLSEEINKIGILNESTTTITNVIKDNPIFPTLIGSLEDLKVKQSHYEFSHLEGYTFIIYHNNNSYHISIIESGILQFDGKNYKIQEDESVKELFTLIKKSTQ
ncbi:hypothetical protein [Lysinibacillus sp. NPDC093692]|uniref:hypothetical protein n=1 Tax=Lysinibacillus sp. NPDC093692 TaxID=3390578 RepID=UPI003D089A33